MKESLRIHGQYDPIVLSREDPPRIIDGRHRFWALKELRRKPIFAPIREGLDELEFIIDQEDACKEQTKSQKAAFAYFLSRLSRVGLPRKTGENCEDLRNYDQETAARRLGVSRKMVGLAGETLSEDSPAVDTLRDSVLQGIVSFNDGLKILASTADLQIEAVEMVRCGQANIVSRALREINEEATPGGNALEPETRWSDVEVDGVTIFLSDMPGLHTLVKPHSIDAIVTVLSTDPKLVESTPELHEFAVHALSPTGLLEVIASPATLLEAFRDPNGPGITFLAEFVILSDRPLGKKRQLHNLIFHHLPVLVFGKAGCRLRSRDNVIRIPPYVGNPVPRISQLMETATELLEKRLIEPGQTLSDPAMLDRWFTALAALKHGCRFVGVSDNAGCVDRIKQRLAQIDSKGKADVRGDPSAIGTQDARASEPTNNQTYLKLDG